MSVRRAGDPRAASRDHRNIYGSGVASAAPCGCNADQYDVELFVSSGASRKAFVLVPPEATQTWPTFRVAGDRLARDGWTFGNGGWQPPSNAEVDAGAAHPYDVGPAWEGGNSWLAIFRLLRGDVTIEAHVDHEWCLENFEAVPDLPSGSPWCWRIAGLPTGFMCGRAENPVLAAVAVENILIYAGCDTFERTQTRRALP